MLPGIVYITLVYALALLLLCMVCGCQNAQSTHLSLITTHFEGPSATLACSVVGNVV